MTWAHYLLQANIYLVVFYAFYKLLLEQETYFQLNRIYLVASGLFASCIPFIRLDWLTQQPVAQQLSVTVGQLDMMVLPDDQQGSGFLAPGNVIAIVYSAGLLFFLLRFCVQLWVVIRNLYFRAGHQAVQQGTAYSFFSRKAVDQSLPGQEIINHHEDVHLKQFHSLDILLFEAISILNWFNPVVYLYKKALKDNHEFLADEVAANYQGDKETYSLLLLSAAFKVSPQALTNSFFTKQSLIKKRIYMLHKEKSKKAAVLKYGIYLPLFSGMLLLSSAKLQDNPSVVKAVEEIPFNDPLNLARQGLPTAEPAAKSLVTGEAAANLPSNLDTNVNSTALPAIPMQDKPYDFVSVDQVPKFPGGIEEFYKYLGENIKYPKEAADKKVEGKVFMQFVVEKDGSLNQIKVISGPGSGTNEEAVRVLTASPKWNPGKIKGKPVRVMYHIPVSFALSKKSNGTRDTNSTTEKTTTINGKVSNVVVVKSNGGSVETQLSSLNLKNGKEPIYIIDGVVANRNVMEKVNPNDIESIHVNKGETTVNGKLESSGTTNITTKKAGK